MSTNFEFPSKDFIPVRTKDGSFTLQGREGEHMHSLEGALSETLYIYGPVAREVMESGWPPRFLSLGLGLGYVELSTVAQALKSSGPWEEFYLLSYESESSLREGLESYFHQGRKSSSLYENLLEAVAAAYGVNPEDLFQTAKRLLAEKKWVLREALSSSSTWPGEKFSGIFFDAFSSKSSPDLWTEEFLLYFIDTFAGSRCLLSTYASTGILRRALISKGFDVERPKGFGKKREYIRSRRWEPPVP